MPSSDSTVVRDNAAVLFQRYREEYYIPSGISGGSEE